MWQYPCSHGLYIATLGGSPGANNRRLFPSVGRRSCGFRFPCYAEKSPVVQLVAILAVRASRALEFRPPPGRDVPSGPNDFATLYVATIEAIDSR